MNILPLVTAFILLFALGAYTMLHQAIATKQEERHFGGAQRLHWRNATQVQRALYKAHPGKVVFPQKKNKTPESHQTYKSPRNKFNLPESAKLNLYPLISKETPDPLLRKVALTLLFRLYEATSLHPLIREEEVLDTLIEVAKNHPELTTLQDLFTKIDETKRPLFYKLLKGTQNYTLFTSRGYPSLTDFFTLVPKRAPILMSYASIPLVIALFGDVYAKHLGLEEEKLWREKERHQPLKQEEVEALFLKYGQSGQNIGNFKSLLDYSRHIVEQEQLIFLDQKSQIQLRVR